MMKKMKQFNKSFLFLLMTSTGTFAAPGSNEPYIGNAGETIKADHDVLLTTKDGIAIDVKGDGASFMSDGFNYSKSSPNDKGGSLIVFSDNAEGTINNANIMTDVAGGHISVDNAKLTLGKVNFTSVTSSLKGMNNAKITVKDLTINAQGDSHVIDLESGTHFIADGLSVDYTKNNSSDVSRASMYIKNSTVEMKNFNLVVRDEIFRVSPNAFETVYNSEGKRSKIILQDGIAKAETGHAFYFESADVTLNNVQGSAGTRDVSISALHAGRETNVVINGGQFESELDAITTYCPLPFN